MQSDLKHLLALQDVDRVVMSVEEELRALEPEIAELDAVLEQLNGESERLQAKLDEAREKRSQLEDHIETYRVMQERRRQKLEWVRGAKEASAMMAEIDLARSVLAKEEAEWIRSADEVQEIEAATREATERVEAANGEQAPRREEIAAIRGECTERLEEALAQREEAAGEIRETKRNLLAMYDRIRSGRAPFAMYELHADACGHCYTSVPMHLRQQIQRNESFATCEACGVLIYIPE